jgi:mRNA interferase RelE/StbE
VSWEVVWTAPAARDMRRLDREMTRRIYDAIHRLATTGDGDVRRLRQAEPEWRLRVGNWRVRFVYDYAARTISVLRILPRGRAYRS